MIRLSALFIVLAGAASANCWSSEETFMSCNIAKNGKKLAVCLSGSDVSYRYGHNMNAPELTLHDNIRTLDYRPWHGFGRTIHEEVTFWNGSYSYTVYGSLDKLSNGGQGQYDGGVVVYKNGAQVTSLECSSASVWFPWSQALSDSKARVGLKWNRDSETWQRGGY